MIILGCVLGCVLMYFALRPKLTATQEEDNKTKEQNIILQNNKQELESRIIELQKTIGNYQDVVNSTKLEITALQTKEKELVEITKMYVEGSTWYPTQGERIKIRIEELLENNLVEEVKVKDDFCDGHIEIINNGIIEYKTYLKCQNYETHGYE